MSNAFISWQSLFTDLDPFGATGKFAAVWFDKLIIETPAEDALQGAIDAAVEHGNIPAGIRSALLDHWKPIQAYVPEFSLVPTKDISDTDPLWKAAVKATYEATEAEHPDHPKDVAFLHEVSMASYGLLRGCESWCSLNAQEATAFIANKREQAVAASLFRRSLDRDFEIFRHFTKLRIPDLNSLSWERVWELRGHPQAEAFRLRVSQLSGPSEAVDSPELAKQLQADFRSSLEEFAVLCRPAPVKATAEAIISNIPLPIPLNR